MVVVDLGTRTARTCGAGCPEVVLLAEPHDAILRDTDLAPDVVSFLVELVDGVIELVLGELQLVHGEVMRPFRRLSLVIAAEREVAQHLEEREVSTGRPDDVYVGGAQTLLARSGPYGVELLDAQEVRLELHHAGRGQEHGRIVRDERG